MPRPMILLSAKNWGRVRGQPSVMLLPYCLVVLGIAVPVGKLVFLCLHAQAGQQKNLQ